MYKRIINIYFFNINLLPSIPIDVGHDHQYNYFSLGYLSRLFPYHCQKEISIFGHLFYRVLIEIKRHYSMIFQRSTM